MDAIELNELIIDDKSVNQELKDFISHNLESTDLYNLCREMYEYVYNSIVKIDGVFHSHIPNENVGNLIRNIEKFMSNNEIEINTVNLGSIIDIIKKYNVETASEQEKSSRFHVERTDNNSNFGKVGTFYDFNTYPMWDELKEDIMNKFIY